VAQETASSMSAAKKAFFTSPPVGAGRPRMPRTAAAHYLREPFVDTRLNSTSSVHVMRSVSTSKMFIVTFM
jgi:hypothetical protein